MKAIDYYKKVEDFGKMTIQEDGTYTSLNYCFQLMEEYASIKCKELEEENKKLQLKYNKECARNIILETNKDNTETILLNFARWFIDSDYYTPIHGKVISFKNIVNEFLTQNQE